ncbi:hypothetical protein A1O1_04843 [Capronia coronata CBS 617.96]|uniref:Transcription factor IIIC putative zinc-finger domain-containing protein n=1 Tax=Capronia coronata CBS 617.96 TaxID=1182541 RepID=W9YF98_9EURO|nr:uncharacterized protein A1O1_04843 [Capronia coronata CBS 617.96]EXJ87916.1 hypothetical protein A1O1_04843 [Capronia coronata CBS 617.96]
MASSTHTLDPVYLPYWPTCKNAVTWSPEHLAVAAGEVVHILTPRESSHPQLYAGNTQWDTFTLRVNLFEQEEWPYQTLAPLRDFSLGEELSDSTIVSIAWSPAGLGIYRRSILAILTSNLVLSFWESDGRLGMWKRTCIVNQNLPTGESDKVRRRRRIRAFCWFPQMTSFEASRWGPQLLAVADDDKTILVFHVQKHSTAAFGGWSFELMAKHAFQNADLQLTGMNSLRAMLSTSSPISKLETTDWEAQQETDSISRTDVLTMEVSLGQCTEPKHLSVQVERAFGKTAGNHRPSHNLKVSMIDSQSPDIRLTNQPLLEPYFEPAIIKLRSEFSEQFDLGGKVRVRTWGTAMSFDKTMAAICISCHPSDMIEYGIPSSQRTVVLFAQLQQPSISETQMPNKSDTAVHEEILSFITQAPADWVKTDMDGKIVHNAAALVLSNPKDHSAMVTWATSILGQGPGSHTESKGGSRMQPNDAMDLDAGTDASIEHNGVPAALATEETCEICEASIPFSPSSDAAKCVNGHQFTRCGLSFVAIQEPGICKYCAKCGRQFLDPGKLEFENGPSLSQALFDKFDVCPYCQGKFRG